MRNLILVTGGGSGIGKECAKKFCENGQDVLIAGRNKTKLKATCVEIKKLGGRCSWISFDITSYKSIEKIMRKIKNRGDVIKIWINSIGTNTPRRDLREMNWRETQKIIDTNLSGAINLSTKIIEHMREKCGGRIIFIGSSAGLKTSILSGVAYSASKRGLFSLVRSINLEEAKNGICASIIAPATVNTELILLRKNVPTEEVRKKILQPEDIAELAYFITQQPSRVVIEQISLASVSEVEFL